MPADRTVLESLLEGRSALVQEVERLNAAIAELDALIGQISGAGRRVSAAIGGELDDDALPPASGGVSAAVQTRSRTTVSTDATRRPPSKKPTGRRSAGRGSEESPKSIRVHVLEMLGAEDREFGLAEIIDRVHDAGIQAHDDAVRSITIKLMKDGRVERVGRGQYRLSRRARGSRPVDAVTETVPEPQADTLTETVDEAPSAETSVVDESSAVLVDGAAPVDEPTDEAAVTDEAVVTDQAEAAAYTPPLNLGQPWQPN